jgi:2-oxoglutarate/2-oxoacid ferredoxin oxidoreductase subunit alpha
MCALLQADPSLMSGQSVVNDFSIVAATVNGSGSQTANNTLVRAIFKMGVPINGKNLFPSNIYGLPTWYTIRLSSKGYVARRDDYHVLAALNPETQAEDLQKLSAGGVAVFPEEWKVKQSRTDITYYPMPVDALVKASGAKVDLREYVANMVYVGALAELLGIDLDEIKAALSYFLKGKTKAIDLNYNLMLAAVEHFRKTYPNAERRYQVARLDPQVSGTAGKVMIDGNSAAGLGAVYGGVTVVAWYPITPSTSLVDALSEYASELRTTVTTDPETGAEVVSKNVAILQAEDELSAIGAIIGAGWAGARSMTATAGPGISLMSEFAGLAYFAEIPTVVWDIQRMGPSTGLPTRTSQGDLLKTYYLSHGDTRQVVLLPGDMKECFEFGWRAFDVADQLQTPVFCLSDLDLGMNLWMTDQFDYPSEGINRGKLFTYEDMAKGDGRYARYRDAEGDGIGQRSLPAQGPAYFARGTGHTEYATYSERPEDWVNNLKRLTRKHDTARRIVPQPINKMAEAASIGIIGYGSSDSAIVEALDLLAAAGVNASYQRVRALPLGEATQQFISQYERIYVVEANDLAQLTNLLRIEYPALATRLIPHTLCNGLPLTARWVATGIYDNEKLVK